MRTNLRVLVAWLSTIGLTTAFAGLPLLTAGAAAQGNHMSVRGTGVFVLGVPVNITVLTGDLAGTLYGANVSIVKVGDDGTLFGVVDHTWAITGKGTFYTKGQVVLSPTSTPGVYQFSEQQFFLPGGTGDFAGTLTGSLLLQGIADLNAGRGSLAYHGVIFVNK